MARISRLHAYLSCGRPFTAESFAREWEGISSRTIKRDLDHLRNYHNAPVEWDAVRRTYRYTRPYDALQLTPFPRINADEALALVLAGRTFAAWRGSAIGRVLAAILEKMAPVLGSALSLSAGELERLIYEPDDAPEAAAATRAEQRHLFTLLDAIRHRRELRIIYKKPRDPKAVSRVIRPLHLAILEHRWMLVAYDLRRRDLRHFLLARIKKLAVTGATFEPLENFDPRAHLSGSMGLFTGAGERILTVRVRFDATAAPYVREHPWHISQTLRKLPRGAVEATLRLNNLVDVRRRILAWGGHARALAPASLVLAVRNEAVKLESLHEERAA
jgi:predicted DNA-binding transcriptional regulator YafY